MENELDGTDAEILRALVEDGRRAYSDIADEVGMSTPAVINRVEGMRESGVIEGIGARIGASVLDTTRLVVRFGVSPDEASAVAEKLADDERVQRVYVSADATVTAVADAQPEEAADVVDGADVSGFEVDVVIDEAHAPTVREPSFAPDCAECGNTVDEEGVSARVAGDVYHFCCTSCESAFRDRYAELG